MQSNFTACAGSSAAMGQVTTGATTHYPNLLPAALVNAGYAVGANVPGSMSNANNSAASGYVLKMSNIPEGTAKYDIVQVRFFSRFLGIPVHLCLLFFYFLSPTCLPVEHVLLVRLPSVLWVPDESF